MTLRKAYVATALFGLFFGCGDAESQTSPELGLASVLISTCAQSSTLHTRYWSRQGQSLEGLTGPSFTMQGARIGCESVSSSELNGTRLKGTLLGQAVSGYDFEGAALQVRDTSGVTSEIAITKIETDSTDPTGQTQLYTLVALDASGVSVRNICKPDAEGRSVAIPLRGRWDDRGTAIADGSITFHCTSGVIAKCVRWGYRPWQQVNGQSLERHHQACTRMARADYCGDGQTHTQEGTQIDMYDGIGVNVPDLSLLSLFEATWGPEGAYCVARDRWLSLLGLLTPQCQGQFSLSLQVNPIRPLDLCLMRRNGTAAQDALINNRSRLNLSL